MTNRPNDNPPKATSETKEVVNVPHGSPPPGGAKGSDQPGMPTKEEVVLKPVGKVREKLSGIQWVGTGLAAAVGALIAVVTVVVLAYAVSHAPVPPTIPNDADVAAKLIANYKLLADTQWAGPAGLFDTIVFKALLPVFTTILGYIFGSRTVSGQTGE